MTDGRLKLICLLSGLACLGMNCRGEAQQQRSTSTLDEAMMTDSIQLIWSCTAPFEKVSRIAAKTILASTVENSALYLIENGVSRLLLQSDGYFGDLEFIAESRKLLVAQGNHQKKSYTVTCYTLE